jgi:hypothetical protein
MGSESFDAVIPGERPKRRSEQPGAEAQVKASVVLAALDHIASFRGALARERVLSKLDPSVRGRFTVHIDPLSWVPLASYDALLDAADSAFGTGNGNVAEEMGAATAARDLPTTHRSFVQTATPSLAVARLPQLFRSYHSRGELRISEAPGGGYRIEVIDLAPETHLHAIAMTGFYRQLLEISGAHDVRVALLSSRGAGDPRTVTSLRWG